MVCTIGGKRGPITFRKRPLMLLAVSCMIAVVIYVYDILNILENQSIIDMKQMSMEVSSFDNLTTVILPATFEASHLNGVLEFIDPSSEYIYIQTQRNKAGNSLDSSIKQADYHNHTIDIFKSSVDIQKNMDKCDSHLKNNLEISISKPQSLYEPLVEIVERFMNEGGAYYEEVKPFLKNLEDEIINGTITQHWYRFIGSSVWLEQYQVHFMVSRIVYSPPGPRNSPLINFMYAQIFDKNWKELKDTELIVPSNNPDIGNLLQNEHVYNKIKYPMILPIAIFHDEKKQINYAPSYGPEDPRIVLVNNPKGYVEPLIIFNAYHRKLQNENSVLFKDGNEVSLKFDYYRTMFLCWPWQLQRGKYNVDDIINLKNYSNLYLRTVELNHKNGDRDKTQKNWTPFTSFKERKDNKYDEFIYFIFEWSNLKILKCELSNIIGSLSNCNFVYQLDAESKNGVGPLRGGTLLFNINELLVTQGNKIPEMRNLLSKLPLSREIWIGFARAHMSDCGCIKQFYRPNLVIVIRDGDKYKVSHVSSFISLDLFVAGWDLKNPENLCSEKSVLIPNSINSWSIDRSPLKKNVGNPSKVGFEDYMTLSITISDNTVEIIHLKGLLSRLFELDFNEEDMSKLFEYSSNNEYKASGYNDDNVLCAMKESRKFCEVFATNIAPAHNSQDI